MDALVGLLRESVIVQGGITLMLIGTYCYLLIIGQAVPSEMYQLLGLIVGFFFGAKVTRPVSEQRVRDIVRKENS
jgi:hypothetical protein